MKTILTIEESEHLIRLGIDEKKAHEFVWNEPCNKFSKCFRLQDLLSILPKEINHQCLTICSTDKRSFAFYGSWEKEYIHSLEQTFIPNEDCGKNSAPELIDALYHLLIWAIENDYVKPNKDN